jgi:light-regulated signal transduction histidine kinase (bacteriophytochrome)
MTLNLGPVDIRKTMDAAAEGVQDRLEQSGIKLAIRTAPDIGTFVADERRVRQALFNLLANAVGFSPSGGVVTLTAQRLKDAVVFLVTDQGPGPAASVHRASPVPLAPARSSSAPAIARCRNRLRQAQRRLHGGTVVIGTRASVATP